MFLDERSALPTEDSSLTEVGMRSFRLPKDRSGIFGVGSRFNHACPRAANVRYVFDQKYNLMVFTAVSDVPAGAELAITYTLSVASMLFNYGFECDCGACEIPMTQEDRENFEYPW